MKKARKRIFAVLCALACAALLAGCAPAAEKEPGGDGPVDPPPAETVSELTFDEGAAEEYVNWYGRYYRDERAGSVFVNNSASGFEVRFDGTQLSVQLRSRTASAGFFDSSEQRNRRTYIGISTDGGAFERRAVSQTEQVTVTLAEGLAEGEHTVKVLKSTEAMGFDLEVFSLETDGAFLAAPEKPARKLEIYGDSITAGHTALRSGTADEKLTTETEDALSSYGFAASQLLGAQANVFCVSGARMGDYGDAANVIPKLYEKTDPAAPGSRAWDFSLYVPDAVIVDLGTNDIILNDASFGTVFEADYKAFAAELREKYPSAAIVVCYGSYGSAAVAAQNALFARLAQELDASLGNVFGFELTRAASGHPRQEEHAANAQRLAAFLEENIFV